jgi:hypothetical protein
MGMWAVHPQPALTCHRSPLLITWFELLGAALLPPLVDVLAPANFTADVMTDDFLIRHADAPPCLLPSRQLGSWPLPYIDTGRDQHGLLMAEEPCAALWGAHMVGGMHVSRLNLAAPSAHRL